MLKINKLKTDEKGIWFEIDGEYKGFFYDRIEAFQVISLSRFDSFLLPVSAFFAVVSLAFSLWFLPVSLFFLLPFLMPPVVRLYLKDGTVVDLACPDYQTAVQIKSALLKQSKTERKGGLMGVLMQK